MQAASLFDGLSFDGFPPFEYGRSSTEVDVGRRQVVQAFVVAAVVANSPYRTGRSDHWLKIKNPLAPAAKREAEEDWG